MRTRISILLLTCLPSLVLVLPMEAEALLPWQPSAAELKLLPPYCQGKARFPVPNVYGNHFCYGLKFLNRADREFKSKEDKSYYLAQAVAEFQSAIEASTEKNATGKYNRFLGLVYKYQADAFLRQKKLLQAIQGYQKSIRYFPKWSQAYIALSRLYKRQGMKKEAREVLEQGLKANPKSRVLKKRLEKFK